MDLSVGAAFLGTGGRRRSLIGRLMVQKCSGRRTGGESSSIPRSRGWTGGHPDREMGRPPPWSRAAERREAVHSLQQLGSISVTQRAQATMPIEVGGINSTHSRWWSAAAPLGLPIVERRRHGQGLPPNSRWRRSGVPYGNFGHGRWCQQKYGDTAP